MSLPEIYTAAHAHFPDTEPLGGEIYADGELIQKNGRFLNKKFPQA